MELTISGHHLDITPSIRQHVKEKLKTIRRHGNGITYIEVMLIVEKQVHKAEGSLHIAGANLFASSESKDMYAAIDSLAHKLDRRLIKHKEKHRGH